jgi:hypothetical protein
VLSHSPVAKHINHPLRFDFRLVFAYHMDIIRSCRVSFTDGENVTHSISVGVESLFEASDLALAEFRRSGFTDAICGDGTRLTIAVEQPSTQHQISVRASTCVVRPRRQESERAGAQVAASPNARLVGLNLPGAAPIYTVS